MNEATKELVALGAAVASNCHNCIDQHLARCDELQVDREEVEAAIKLGLTVRQAAELAIKKHTQGLMSVYPQEAA